MKCDNEYCVYNNEDGQCMLDEITVDGSGMCADCIELSFTREEREEKRRIMLIEFAEREKEDITE